MDLQQSHPTDVRSELRRLALVVGAFGGVALLAGIDLAMDLKEGTTLQHALVEGLIVIVGTVGITLGVRRFLALRHREKEALQEVELLGERLHDSRAEAERWRGEAQDLLQGLGAMIDTQFQRWGLTRAEKQVASLVLKGYSHKEIAVARRVGHATVRQQATAIYRKAGVDGRHDLAAFFLEGLLCPGEANGGPEDQASR